MGQRGESRDKAVRWVVSHMMRLAISHVMRLAVSHVMRLVISHVMRLVISHVMRLTMSRVIRRCTMGWCSAQQQESATASHAGSGV